MSAIDEELWANLYIFGYSEPNKTTSLATNYHACSTARSQEGQEPSPERVPATRRLPATCCSGGACRSCELPAGPRSGLETSPEGLLLLHVAQPAGPLLGHSCIHRSPPACNAEWPGCP